MVCRGTSKLTSRCRFMRTSNREQPPFYLKNIRIMEGANLYPEGLHLFLFV